MIGKQGNFHGSISCDAGAKYPPEAGRYVLYVASSCPFAARTWLVYSFYGLDAALRLVRVFPVVGDHGWFFEAKSDREKWLTLRLPNTQYDSMEPLYGAPRLSDLIKRAKNSNQQKKESGKLLSAGSHQARDTVPLLWDTKTQTIVSDDSIDISRMLATEMRHLGRRNQTVDLFPPYFAASWDEGHTEAEVHQRLLEELSTEVSIAVYEIHTCGDQRKHGDMTDAFFRKLDALSDDLRLSPFLMGDSIRFLDFVLFATLVRFDVSYQWAFRLGKRSIREDYPILWRFVRRIYSMPGIDSTVHPTDIMSFCWLSSPLRDYAGETVPILPEAYSKSLLQSGGELDAPLWHKIARRFTLSLRSVETYIAFIVGFLAGIIFIGLCESHTS